MVARDGGAVVRAQGGSRFRDRALERKLIHARRFSNRELA